MLNEHTDLKSSTFLKSRLKNSFLQGVVFPHSPPPSLIYFLKNNEA